MSKPTRKLKAVWTSEPSGDIEALMNWYDMSLLDIFDGYGILEKNHLNKEKFVKKIDPTEIAFTDTLADVGIMPRLFLMPKVLESEEWMTFMKDFADYKSELWEYEDIQLMSGWAGWVRLNSDTSVQIYRLVRA